MNPTELMRTEILRLAGAASRPAFINMRRLSAFYNVPEKGVRRELANLAQEKRIRLSGWDGKAVRPHTEWHSSEEFLENSPEGVPAKIELME
jgi:hypothetical protein